MRKISYNAAEQNLKRLFKDPKRDAITVGEASSNWGREITTKEKNREWLRDHLAHLKEHGIAQPIYSNLNGREVLTGIKLTLKGMTVLNSKESTGDNPNDLKGDPYRELYRLIDSINKDNPDLVISVNITPRNK